MKLNDEQRRNNLIKLHERDGGHLAEEASFTCPRCGIRPMLFEDNRKWNNGIFVVECLCMAPFSPKPEFEEQRQQAHASAWVYPMLNNADEWGVFVNQKLEEPVPMEDDEDEEAD